MVVMSVAIRVLSFSLDSVVVKDGVVHLVVMSVDMRVLSFSQV